MMSGATLKVTNKDEGWDALKDRVLKLSTAGAYSLVGVQGQQASSAHREAAPMTVVDLAVVHEFGAVIRTSRGKEIVIPQRSFIRATIDEHIMKHVKNWELHRIAAVDRNILRLAIYEMLHREDIPPVVSINEAVDIAKKFSTEDSGKFVNGILDKIRAELPRPARNVK